MSLIGSKFEVGKDLFEITGLTKNVLIRCSKLLHRYLPVKYYGHFKYENILESLRAMNSSVTFPDKLDPSLFESDIEVPVLEDTESQEAPEKKESVIYPQSSLATDSYINYDYSKTDKGCVNFNFRNEYGNSVSYAVVRIDLTELGLRMLLTNGNIVFFPPRLIPHFYLAY